MKGISNLMAIYHLQAKVFKRSKGHSAVAAAAYRSGEDLRDERQAKTHYYGKRQGNGIEHTQILTPDHAPDWMKQRENLWNGVEKAEYRRDAQVAREVEVALPRELSSEQQKKLAQDFAKEQFVEKGMVADIAFHNTANDNPHAHMMLTTRNIEENGFGKKNRGWNDKKTLQSWREAWTEHVNKALEDSGHTSRVDHRTLEKQGIDRVPQIHRGKDATALQRKGEPTPRLNKLQKGRDTSNAFRGAFNEALKNGNFRESDHRNVQKSLQKYRENHDQGKEAEHDNHREKDQRDVQNNLNKHRRNKPPRRKPGDWERYLSEKQKKELQREDR